MIDRVDVAGFEATNTLPDSKPIKPLKKKKPKKPKKKRPATQENNATSEAPKKPAARRKR
jgi:ATP-dependent RNA helicase RhlE